MSTIAISLNRQLARTVALTGRLKGRSYRFRPAAALTAAVDFVARGVFYLWRNHQYLTLIKLANMALVNIQFKLKSEYVFGRPYKMKIESTNICNTQCQLCPTGIGLQGRAKGKMSFSQYKSLIDSLRWYLFGLDLSMWGDPMIVPEIYDMIRHAHDRGIWTYISSNLHAFKPDKGHAEALVNSGLDVLTCSLHGATQKTFEIYQPGKNFGDAVAKVRHIIATRNRMGSATPMVQLNFVVTRQNEHEIEAFEQLAEELDCKAVFSTASLNIRFLDKDKKLQSLGLAPDLLAKKTRQHIEQWMPRDEQYTLEPYKQILKNGTLRGEEYNGKKVFDCSWPWRMSVINWDGQVVTCCGNFDPDEDMGNVFEQGFAKIWNGEKYRLSRRSFKRRLNDSQVDQITCATCPGFML